MVDWNNVTLEDMMNAIQKLVKQDVKGKYCFDVSIFDGSEEREKVYVVIEDGAMTWGKGASGDPGTVLFQIKKGGMETMRALQEEGLSAAMRMMMTGHIYTTNPMGAQKWFDILEIGKEPLEKALSS